MMGRLVRLVPILCGRAPAMKRINVRFLLLLIAVSSPWRSGSSCSIATQVAR